MLKIHCVHAKIKKKMLCSWEFSKQKREERRRRVLSPPQLLSRREPHDSGPVMLFSRDSVCRRTNAIDFLHQINSSVACPLQVTQNSSPGSRSTMTVEKHKTSHRILLKVIILDAQDDATRSIGTQVKGTVHQHARSLINISVSKQKGAANGVSQLE